MAGGSAGRALGCGVDPRGGLCRVGFMGRVLMRFGWWCRIDTVFGFMGVFDGWEGAVLVYGGGGGKACKYDFLIWIDFDRMASLLGCKTDDRGW